MPTSVKTIHVYVVLLPGSLLLDIVGPMEVLQYANRLGEVNFVIHFVGPKHEVDNSIGLAVTASNFPQDLADNAWVFVQGMLGDHVDLQGSAIDETCEWLAQHPFKQIVSVCGGALVLAKAGLLAHKKCTTHYMHIEQLRQMTGTHLVLENRLFVQDGNVYTSAGVTSGIDLALYLVEQQCSAAICAKIARRMVLFTRRGAQDPAQSPYLKHRNHLNEKVLQVQDLIQSDPAKNWSQATLAKHVHCSERHLSRMFKQQTGMSSKTYLYEIRLALAKQLLQSSNLKIEEVARRCGFEDPRQFRRLWARYHNSPPSAFRQGVST
ncbi:MAG: transcriptional regulator GlxA family with amidase domain [Paraglaciecola sp.]|jgi:transcriptional regulator GlxA family with amidase domain